MEEKIRSAHFSPFVLGKNVIELKMVKTLSH